MIELADATKDIGLVTMSLPRRFAAIMASTSALVPDAVDTAYSVPSTLRTPPRICIHSHLEQSAHPAWRGGSVLSFPRRRLASQAVSCAPPPWRSDPTALASLRAPWQVPRALNEASYDGFRRSSCAHWIQRIELVTVTREIGDRDQLELLRMSSG